MYTKSKLLKKIGGHRFIFFGTRDFISPTPLDKIKSRYHGAFIIFMSLKRSPCVKISL
jgi:hypothetical protein